MGKLELSQMEWESNRELKKLRKKIKHLRTEIELTNIWVNYVLTEQTRIQIVWLENS